MGDIIFAVLVVSVLPIIIMEKVHEKMPTCQCGKKMKRWLLHVDLWGNECFECEHCGRFMKKVPYGNPEKKTYFFFILLSLFFEKKLWLHSIDFLDNKTPKEEES